MIIVNSGGILIKVMQAFAIIRVGCRLQRSVFKYIRRRIVQIFLTKIVLNGSFRDFYHQNGLYPDNFAKELLDPLVKFRSFLNSF